MLKQAALIASLALLYGAGFEPALAAPQEVQAAAMMRATPPAPLPPGGSVVPVVYAGTAPDGRPEMLMQQFVPLDPVTGEPGPPAEIPKGAVVGVSGKCPEGWSVYVDADGSPLFFPLGLIVDKDGKPRVGSYGLLSACEKQ